MRAAWAAATRRPHLTSPHVITAPQAFHLAASALHPPLLPINSRKAHWLTWHGPALSRDTASAAHDRLHLWSLPFPCSSALLSSCCCDTRHTSERHTHSTAQRTLSSSLARASSATACNRTHYSNLTLSHHNIRPNERIIMIANIALMTIGTSIVTLPSSRTCSTASLHCITCASHSNWQSA